MSGLHISIGSSPQSQLTLQHDLNMVKAGLLYADNITLYSLQASAFMSITEAGALPHALQLRVIELVAPHLAPLDGGDVVSQVLRQSREKRYRTTREIVAQKQLEAMIDKQWPQILQIGQQVATQVELPQLEYAINQGLLKVHRFRGMDTQEASASFFADCVIKATNFKQQRKNTNARHIHDTDAVIMEYLDLISSAVSSGQTFPLFDHSTGNLVRLSIEEKKMAVSDVMLQRSRHSPLAASLFDRLPLFPSATVEEVIDIRNELEKPLVNFRKGVVEYSDTIASAPWDEDFTAEADILFYERVAPSIQELGDILRTEASLAAFVLDSAKKIATIDTLGKSAALSIGLSTLSNLPEWVAMTLGVGLPIAAAVRETYKDWVKQRSAVERNSLYFYYRLKKYLG